VTPWSWPPSTPQVCHAPQPLPLQVSRHIRSPTLAQLAAAFRPRRKHSHAAFLANTTRSNTKLNWGSATTAGWRHENGTFCSPGARKETITIEHRYYFSSALKRMAAVVRLESADGGAATSWVVAKGAPEVQILEALSDSAQGPISSHIYNDLFIRAAILRFVITGGNGNAVCALRPPHLQEL